jgi:hypothetical protein
MMKMVHRRCSMAARDGMQGVVLSDLDLLDPGFADNWFPKGGKLADEWHNGGFVGHLCIFKGKTSA